MDYDSVWLGGRGSKGVYTRDGGSLKLPTRVPVPWGVREATGTLARFERI